MLDIIALDVRVAGRPLLEEASVKIPEGQHAALVGRNGIGKSTLLKVILGTFEPDGGEIRLPRGWRIGTVAQEAPGGPESPLEIVLAADTERAALLAEMKTASVARQAEIADRLTDISAHTAEARAATILVGLGFDHDAQNRPMSSFSGGWRMRVALAAALFAEPDLLLLDEPTNHLDLEAALWLESFLKRWPRTFLLVSHDRAFLNNVCDQVVHVDQRKLVAYKGDYDNFVRTRAERLANLAAENEKIAARRAHMQAYVDRFRASATKARQAQSRLKAMAKLAPIQSPERDPTLTFNLPQPDELSPPLLVINDGIAGYGDVSILKRLSLRVDPDDRIVLLGSNGNGKSTLAKTIAGRLPLVAGERVASSKMRVGFFAQHQIEELDPKDSAIQHLQRLRPSETPQQIRGRLGRFGFSGERAEQACGTLSGGEKARLTLCLITHDSPHLLILDEPTNHLDIEAREALIEGLADYRGAVILVSHDRHLVDLVADRLWLVRDGSAAPFEGTIEDYETLVLQKPTAAERNGGDGGANKKQDRRDAAGKRAQNAPLRKKIKELEAQIDKLDKARVALDAELADPRTYDKGGAYVADLGKRRDAALSQIAELEDAWMHASQELEALS